MKFKNIFFKTLITLSLSFFVMGTSPTLFAQPLKQLYPTLSITQKQETQSRARYRIDKHGTEYRVIVRLSGGGASIQIQNTANSILGEAVVQMTEGGCKDINVSKTQKGLLDLWQFSFDRVQVRQGVLTIFPLRQIKAAFIKCLIDCRKQQMDDAIAADNDSTQVFFMAISIPNEEESGNCTGYIPCTMALVADYDSCFCQCRKNRKK